MPHSTRRAEPAPLAAEGDQLVVAAVTAAQPQEAMGQDAAFDEGVELVFDELRQVGPGVCAVAALGAIVYYFNVYKLEVHHATCGR